MIPINCRQHPWMITYLGVLPYPFFAVTDRNGYFRIGGLPPGNYTIAAWHERFGEKTIEVTVTPRAQQTLSFEFSSADDHGARSPRVTKSAPNKSLDASRGGVLRMKSR
jgi:hypothetical protein